MNYQGLLLLDKPSGLTSHDVVAHVRRVLQTKSVGHCGTLDPLATGLMILLVGEATKLSQYLLERDKAYRVRLELGIETDSGDSTGQVLKQEHVQISAETFQLAAQKLVGSFEWPVPKFSAVKVGGEKLYEKARREEEFVAPIKKMEFWGLRILECSGNQLEAEISCSKGSYIRSWVTQLGHQLGTVAVMTGLRRLVSSPYRLEEALTFEELSESLACPEGLTKGYIPMSRVLPEWKTIRIDGQSLGLMRNGQISSSVKSQLISLFRPGVDLGVKMISKLDGSLVALVGLEADRGFVIRRVFHS